MVQGVTWLGIPLGVACLAVGLLHLGMPAARRASVTASAPHALMGLGMAAMFVPPADPLPQLVWVAAFALVAAWFGAEALRAGSLLGAAGHHVVGAAAMLFMLLGGHDHGSAPAGGAVDPEHAHHAAAGGSGPGLLVTALALAFAAWFVADTVRALTRTPVPAGGPAVGVPRAEGLGGVGVAHLAMNVAMAVMLIGMA